MARRVGTYQGGQFLLQARHAHVLLTQQHQKARPHLRSQRRCFHLGCRAGSCLEHGMQGVGGGEHDGCSERQALQLVL